MFFIIPSHFSPSQPVPCMEKQPLIWFLLFTSYFLPILVKVLVAQSCPTLCDPMDCSLPGSSVHGIKNTGMDCHFLLQEIFPTQGSNTGLLHCEQILYCLIHQAYSRISYKLAFTCYVSAPGFLHSVYYIEIHACCCLLQ